MKKIINLLISIVFLTILSLKAQDSLLSGYSELMGSTKTVAPSPTASIDRNSSDVKIKDKYEWLVFVFINGVNDLGILRLSLNDINEMETFGSSDKVAVVVEHNRIEGQAGRTLKFSDGAVTYFITKDRPNNPEIVSKIIDETPDGDMGSYRHFVRSVKKAIKRFKPDKLMLIIWNHGNGYFGISYDDVSGNAITVPQIKSALSEIVSSYGKKVDIFAMDACLMQMAEVVYEIKNYANFIVASEESIPGGGFPYDDLLNTLERSTSIKQAASGVVEDYHRAYDSQRITLFGRYDDKSTTLSAIDTSKYSSFINLLNNWISAAIRSEDFKAITAKEVTEKSFFFLGGEQQETVNLGESSILTTETEDIMTRSADLVDYLKKAMEKMKDEKLKSLTQKLIDFITNKLIVIHKGGDYQNSKGLSYKDETYGIAIYFPLLRYNSAKYESLGFSKASLWDEFIKKMLGRENIEERAEYNIGGEDASAETVADGDEETIAEPEAKTVSKSFSNVTQTNKVPDIPSGDIALPVVSKAMHSLNSNSQMVKLGNNITAKPINIYSTIYTTDKTLKPDIDKLVGARSGSNETQTKTTESNKTEQTQNVQKGVIEKSKDALKNIALLASEKTKDLIEKVFPDKEKQKAYNEILKEFEVEISTKLSLSHSKKLVEDQNLQKELLKIDRNKTLKLISYANEIIELDRIVSKSYQPEDINPLSKTLETTLDKSRLICDLKICIPPEKLSEWMSNSGRYKNDNISNVETAIRKWEKIFTDPVQFTAWAQAGYVRFTTTTWSNMSIKERNVALDRFIKEELKSGTTSSALISLSDRRLTNARNYQELSVAVEKVSQKMLDLNVLNASELAVIRNKPLSEQMYILSNLFDRGGIKTDETVSSYVKLINANRTSFTNEVIDSGKRTVLSTYLSNSIKTEVSKSQTAKALYSQVYGNKKPTITVEYLEGVESKNDGQKIIIDAKIVEQFLRVKGYTSTDLLKNKTTQSELLSYISPLVVREMANISISRSMDRGYSPQVREKYATALLYQAKYTQERMGDKSFKELFESFSGVSDYADKVMVVKRNYEKADNVDDFIQTAGLRYYSNMPAASSAKSEILIAISKELERRNALDKKEKDRIDKYAIFGDKEIYGLSPFEITNYIKDIKTDALLKLQKDLSDKSNFSTRLENIIGRIK
ncbi:MAG: hypothetical protein K6357_05690 [Elusimicrobiota bacterium]